MNLDQFAASFRPVERPTPSCEEGKPETPAEVVIAGTVLKASKDTCVLEINGAAYELPGECVVDIQLVSSAMQAAAKDAAREAGEEAAAERKEAPAADTGAESGVAFVKVKGDAVLTRKVEVPACLIAATGTWVSLVPGATGQA